MSLILLLVGGIGCHAHRHMGPGEGSVVLTPRTPQQTTGVVVLAHGGTPAWNHRVQQVVEQAALPYPLAIAFGMGMGNSRPQLEAAQQLTQRGVRHLIVVPLLISSHSTVFRQLEYIFRLRPAPAFPGKVQQIPETLAVSMTSALDGHPLIAEILWERCQRLSRTPSRETVILVAHGPNEAEDNQRWLEGMQRVARTLKTRGGFRDVLALTLRDDAEPAVQRQATEALRHAVTHANQSGETLVIPVLLAQGGKPRLFMRGGIENNIAQRLKGFTYRYSGETLLPHPNIARWIRAQVDSLATKTASGS